MGTRTTAMARKSPWVFHVNCGSCNGCDIELVATFAPRYDLERFGCLLVGSPRHADILIVTGPVTRAMKDGLLDIYGQVPEPRKVVAIGACAIGQGVFHGSDTLDEPLDTFLPVDVYIAGCPPRPETIIGGLIEAINA